MKISIRQSHTKSNCIGENISDSFLDSFEQEALACCDILDRVNICKTNLVQITFMKEFLKNIIHSHLIHIREMEHSITGRKYAN